MIVTWKMVYDELQIMKEEDMRNSIKNSNRMKPTLTQEAKSALIEALEKMKTANFNTRPDNESSSDFAYRVAIEIVESFQVSDGWKPNPTDNWNQNANANWIPCSERLPEEWQHVLIYERKFIHDATFERGIFIYWDFETEADVTHWQHLPSVPNKRSE